MNAIVFGGEKGARSEGRGLFWYCFRDAVNDDKMISPAITVHDEFIIILSQYIVFSKTYVMCYMMHILYQDKTKGDYFNFLGNDNPLYF